MASNICRELCAIIEARDGSTFKVRVDEDCVNEYIPKLFEFNANQEICEHAFCVGDQIKICVSEKSNVVEKVESRMPLTTIHGTMKHWEKAYGVINADDLDVDVLFYNSNHNEFCVGDRIKCDCIEGMYEMNGISYSLRAARLQLKANKNDQNDLATSSDKSNEHSGTGSSMDSSMNTESIPEDFAEYNNNQIPHIKFPSASRSSAIFKDYPYQKISEQNGLYLLPSDLYDIFKVDKNVNQMAAKLQELVPKSIDTKESYAKYYHNLIHLEEVEMKHAFKFYKSEDVSFEAIETKKFTCFKLRCVIIPELRPPISVGDFVHAFKGNSHKYSRGIVERIDDEYFTIKFTNEFIRSFTVHDKFNIEFHYNRLVFRRKHHAVDRTIQKFSDQFIFPTKLVVTTPQLNVSPNTKKSISINKEPLKLFMDNLNDEQKEAVKQALSGECRPLPYIIYGPPGVYHIYQNILYLSQY